MGNSSRSVADDTTGTERLSDVGHLFVFRGRGGGLIKVLRHGGQGDCLLTRKLDAAVSSGHRPPMARW
ncbi:transposase [Rhizobium laguerreae]|nr:IS66 family insertion sequence element accessory protein TnpB [Rhizobium laguerreae]MBY5551551.1 transposase [Rhizobium leguminosarum]MBY3143856.1 transposase [Rhizobium laguerreae]MBY3238590.1 transposase [Rhizobium laguerreae]MBY3321764.1 transposase [Rhizobium laguerreae]